MSWYTTGTIAVTNGSTTITGTGTAFVANVQKGFAFLGPDYSVYEIDSVTSDTVAVLTKTYRGSTASAQAYGIFQTQGIIADLSNQVATLLSTFGPLRAAYPAILAGVQGTAKTFVAGVDFTAGTTTTLTLSQAYSNTNQFNLFFDGVYQGPDQILSLIGTTCTLTSAIPVGVSRVYERGSSPLGIGTPAMGSVGVGQLASDAIALINTPIADYTALRAFSSGVKSVYVTGYLVTAAPSGIAGVFVRDDHDTTSADNGGTIIVSGAVRWKRQFNGSYDVRWFGAKCDGTTSDTSVVNSAISYISAIPSPFNGGELRFPAGICIANVVMKPRVRLIGGGLSSTIIRAEANSSAPILSIAITDVFIGWEGITFDGNKANSATGSGIVFSDSYNIPYQPGVDDAVGPSALASKTASGDSPYKYCAARNFAVVNCGGNGVTIGALTYGNYAVFLSDFHCTLNNGHGFENHSTDNIFYGFYCERNGKAGLYNRGSNNKFIGAKTIFSGTIDASFAGLDHSGNRCDFVAFESQDNYCDGYTLVGDDNHYDLLSDSNGYAAGNTNASSRVAAGIRFLGGRRNKVKARVTNYRASGAGTGRLADGFYASEWPYVISSNDYFDSFDISVREYVANQAPVGDKVASGNSDLVICKRASSVTKESITFTADQPAIVQNSGLYFSGVGETIEIARSINPGLSLSYAIEFEYTSSTQSAPRVVRSEGNTFALYMIMTGGTHNPSFEIDVNVGGVSKANTLWQDDGGVTTLDSSDFYAGNKFLIAGNLYIQGTNLVRDEIIRTFDSAGLEKTIRHVTSQTIVAGAQFDLIRNPIITDDTPNQTFIGKMRGVAMWPSNRGNGAVLEKLAGSGIADYHDRGGIYTNFLQYSAPIRESRIRSLLPTAGAFYRGQTAFIEATTGVADTLQVCRKKADDSYEWITTI